MVFILIISGFVVGFLNTLAGGASVISMSLFLAMDMPIVEAIATNRIAIFLQNLTSTLTFRSKKLLNIRSGLIFAIPTTIGSIIGAQLSITMDERVIETLFIVALVIIGVLVFIKPESWLKASSDREPKMGVKGAIILFLAGLYGGSVYVGLGYIVLAILVVGLGYDLIRANAIKGFLSFITTPFALVIFAMHGEINYTYGLIHAVGNILGSYIAANYAQKIGTKTIRYILMALIAISTISAIWGICNEPSKV